MATQIPQTPTRRRFFVRTEENDAPRPSMLDISSSGHAGSVAVSSSSRLWLRMLGFVGPGFLISVGYMDPGNWATDLAAGSRYGYTLLFAIMVSNLMAILLQSLSLKLGIVTEQDLAQLCRARYPRWVSHLLWVFAEIAIAACDLAEVIGSAIALQLLFHLPLLAGVLVTGVDVLLILLLERRGFRTLEALVMVLIGTIAVLFGVEIILARPELAPILHDLLVPSKAMVTDPAMLYRHWNSWRDGDAAQSVSSLVAGPDAQLPAHHER